jgi:hypothetical protein
MQIETKRTPVLSLNAALAQSLDVIDSCKAPVAIFLKGGEIKFIKSTSKLFGKKTEAMIGNLVGVYPPKAVLFSAVSMTKQQITPITTAKTKGK